MTMSLLFPLLFTSFLILSSSLQPETTQSQNPEDSTTDEPDTVMLVILARSRAHILPHWLGLIEQLNYPKSAISVYIHTDHNQDDTPVLLSEWAEAVGELYKGVTVNTSSKIAYTQSLGPSNWEEDRHVHIMKVRQAALDHGRAAGVKYLFVVDTDNFLTNPETLNILISQKKSIVAPMLTISDAVAYSNYWAGMTPAGYYQSAPEYFDILNRKTVGVHKVPMVHSTLLFDLQNANSTKLHYWPVHADYTGPVDDIIYLALTAASAEIGMWVDNSVEFGWMLPRGEYNTVGEEVAAYQEYFADHLSLKSKIPRSSHLKSGTPTAEKLGFDEIYMINLERRPERRARMQALFALLGIDATMVNAVDGKTLTDEKLEEMKVKQLIGYEDPYLKRPLKLGEIGCFLSHYSLWKDVVDRGLRQVIVFEDDVRFKPNFKSDLTSLMSELKSLELPWDLVYLSRKILHPKSEKWVPNSSRLVVPGYSYWTTGYILSLSGAKKLLAQQPLQKMMAVDEYIPVMFDNHPNDQWKSQFRPRDLVAYSASPLLAEPQFYIGQPGYISDTELSSVIDTSNTKDEL